MDGIPSASGIQLISTRTLPDRVRSVFPHPLFNAIQSKCFASIYNTSDNFLLCAPTGSGKTVILELAICRFVAGTSASAQSFKAVYQAPTKALCTERCRDWKQKFSHLSLKCAELTGDTEQNEIKAIQGADIIITTPEKWDSATRKWKDQRKLMDLIKLFLIDEVHILKDDRGATLEAVVSRMRSIGRDVRFVALSATVPNSEDVAKWLGLNSQQMHLPAIREVFGEDFRPVRLEKHIIGLQGSGNNDWIFDRLCGNKLPDVIIKHSESKPIMVFCITRKVAKSTALDLAKWWHESRSSERYWESPRRQLRATDEDLTYCMKAGVAFHHAGIPAQERHLIEEGYISGDVNVICCTATLAVGVNLPCHLVIVKNTVLYQTETASCVEYSDLDMMQMLGRAGRPQFDKSAVAVILTRQEKALRYEKMVQGQELLESRLHLNIIEHLNSEVGMGTIFDLRSACRWLESTFLYVRITRNPGHYKIAGDVPGEDLGERVKRICMQGLEALQQYDLIQCSGGIRSTELGDAMSRYSVTFYTMKLVLGLQRGAKTSEVLSAVAQASEFSGLRFRAGEKAMYKDFNLSNMARFPIKVNLDCPGHKVSLIVQSVLAGVDPTSDKRFQNLTSQYFQDKQTVLHQARRLLRCVTDCEIHLQDSIAARTSMALARSLAAGAWDDGPCQLAQVEQIGPVAVRRLAGAQIRTVEDLESCEPRKIEMILSRNPPFGSVILKNLQHFPRLRVSMKIAGLPMSSNEGGVTIKVQAELGFFNNQVPTHFRRLRVHVCFLAEASEGRLLHFCRTNASRLTASPLVSFTAALLRPLETITGYVSCDDIAGTMTYARLEPEIPVQMFSRKKTPEAIGGSTKSFTRHTATVPCDETCKPMTEDYSDEIADDDLFHTLDEKAFADIDDVSSDEVVPMPAKLLLAGEGKLRKAPEAQTQDPVITSASKRKTGLKIGKTFSKANPNWQPERLKNGNWKCSHHCKDKLACKHNCCRNGAESKPKPPRPKKSEELQESTIMQAFRQKQLQSAFVQENHGQPTHSKPVSGASACAIIRHETSSPAIYDEDDDVFDDIDKDALQSAVPSAKRRISKCRPGEKHHSLFKNNTSSPEKSLGHRKHVVEELDLSSDIPDTVSPEKMTKAAVETSRRSSSPTQREPKRKRLATLNDIESTMPTALSNSRQNASNIMQSSAWPTQPWSQEAEDLLGPYEFEQHGRRTGFPHRQVAHDTSSTQLNATAGESNAAEDDYQADLGSEDLHDLVPEYAPWDQADITPEEEASALVAGNVDHKPDLATAAESGHLDVSRVTAQDEVDAYIMQEFGEYVNFV